MCVSYENLLYLAHLDIALLHLMLRRLATIEEPDVSVEPQGEGGVVARGRGLSGRCPKEGDSNGRYKFLRVREEQVLSRHMKAVNVNAGV